MDVAFARGGRRDRKGGHQVTTLLATGEGSFKERVGVGETERVEMWKSTAP